MTSTSLAHTPLCAAVPISKKIKGKPLIQSAKKVIKSVKPSRQGKQVVKVHTLAELKPIRLTANSSVELTAVNLHKQDEGNILAYTLTYKNNEQRSLALTDYWTKVRTNSGTVYGVKVAHKDKEKKSVPGHSKASVTYYTKIANSVTLHDVHVDIVKWDFKQSEFESRLGSRQVPKGMTTATLAGKSSVVRMNDIPVQASIQQVHITPQDNANVVNVKMNLENIGHKTVEDARYHYVITTANGSSYPLMADSGSKQYQLRPGDKKTLHFATEIPKHIKLQQQTLQVLADNELAKEEGEKLYLPVATFMLPFSQSQATGNQEQVITIDRTKINTKVIAGWANESYDQNDITLTFQFENLSKHPITLPKYQFVITGPNGLSIPIENKMVEQVTLKSMEKRPLSLQAMVATDVKLDQLRLQLNKITEETTTEGKPPADASHKKLVFLEATYKLPDLSSMRDQMGIEYDVQHSKGNLGITMESLQRLPWLDGDMLSAKLKIRNKENKTIQLPMLEGMFKLDTAPISGKTQVISSNGSLIIGAQENVDVYIVTKVPDYMNFSQIQTSLLEKISDTDKAAIMQFTNGGKLSEVAVVDHDKVHQLNTQGRKAEIHIHKSKVYAGTVEQTVYTDFIMKNLEERQTTLSQLVAYYRTEDGRYYKANIAQVEGPTSPQGLNVVTAWAKLPKSVQKKGIQLIIGEGITENKLTPPKEKSDGYINAVAMKLDIVEPSSKRDFINLDLFPYTLTLYNFYVTANGSSNVSIEFTYDMIRQLEYNVGEYGHKLVLEIVDASGRKFEKEIDFSKEFKEGKNKSFSTTISDAFFEKIKNGGFQINVYDWFDKEKIKMAGHGSAYNIQNLKTAD